MNTEICSVCKWFDQYPEEEQLRRGVRLGGWMSGVCRRNAPRPEKYSDALWPQVKANDWCGEFTAQRREYFDPSQNTADLPSLSNT